MGHTAPVKCIAKATAGSEAHHVVTSSENGEMFAWDTVDGRCLENRKHPGYIHTSIQVMIIGINNMKKCSLREEQICEGSTNPKIQTTCINDV